jgi:Pilus formation protein N terminal region
MVVPTGGTAENPKLPFTAVFAGFSTCPARPQPFELIHQLTAKFEPPWPEFASGSPRRGANIYRGGIMRAVIAFAAPVHRPAQIAASIVLAMTISSAHAAEALNVIMDQAKIARVPDHTTTLVVGNPLIADVSVQAGGVMVVTGKGYGVTNVIALDRAGKVLANELVRVKGPAESLVVYRGATRESYSCAPNCERRITLGDSPEFFDTTLGQATIRSNRALSGQAPAPGR